MVVSVSSLLYKVVVLGIRPSALSTLDEYLATKPHFLSPVLSSPTDRIKKKTDYQGLMTR
jgi:hypothetical protein